MNHGEIIPLRLQTQQLILPKFTTAEELVSHMGAMQAQDFAMSKRAVGMRLKKANDADIQKALDDGKVLRTHLMRPTWHLVAADDIQWMLELTAPQIRSAMKSRSNELGLTETVLKKSAKIIEEILKDGALKRDVLLKEFSQRNMAINENRSSHLLMHAEIDGLICSGPMQENKQTYALLENRVSRKKSISRFEAVEKLARKYFNSHAPATLDDFVWWSGLPVKDARFGIEAIGHDFDWALIDGKNYLIPKQFTLSKQEEDRVLLLPSFDEYLISYKDRTAVLEKLHHKKAVSINGIFNPVILIEGIVVGTWKRIIKNGNPEISVHPFSNLNKKQTAAIQQQVGNYLFFLGKQ